MTQNVEERGDLTLTDTIINAGGTRSSISVHGGVLGVERVGDTTINTIVLAQALPFASPGRSNIGGAYVGAAFDWSTRSGVSIFAAGEYIATSDSTSIVTAKGGVRVGF